MNPLFLLVVWIPITCTFRFVSCLKTDINTDMSVLLTLKSQLIIPKNYSTLDTNWSADSPVCSWLGLTCGVRHHRVTSLNLSSIGLVGVLPPHLGNLSFLTSIDLLHNSFHGSIPSELFLLHRLEYADLSRNQFTGRIPSTLFLAPSLRKVSLAYNFLTGSIPNDVLFNTTSPLQAVYLTLNKLTGELPAEIFHHLPHLQKLSVSENMLSGPIPSSLSHCEYLQILGLSLNEFEGSIPPGIGNLTMLKELYLVSNKLTGAIPLEIGDLVNLEKLNLMDNALTGEIPSVLVNLTKLIQLTLKKNNLTGPIPQQIGYLQSLQIVNFANNDLMGALPPSFFNISSLMSLSLAENYFSGSLPLNFGFNLQNLERLVLAENLLSGSIPTSMFNLSKLEYLELSSNLFSGAVPNEFGHFRLLQGANLRYNNFIMISSASFFSSLANCRSLRIFVLADNPLNTILPSCIGNLSVTLQLLYLTNCKLHGTIPHEVGKLVNLNSFTLDVNNLSGTIPTTIGRIQNLQGLFLGENKLQGEIPSSICQLSSIFEIILDRNELRGWIPACLGSLSSLRRLTMSNNKLNMTIPSSLWNLKDLLVLDLSRNSFSGLLPQDIGNLKAATWLSFSHNQFFGNIPPTIGDLINVQNLSFASNKLDGSIPASFGNLISLQYLDLSSNNLSGVIPKTLEKVFNLEYFNVSANRLEGEIPDGGPFANLSAQSFMLNGDLCGSPRFEVPPCRTVAPRKKKTSVAQIKKYVIPIISAALIVSGLVFLVLILVRRRRTNTLTEMVPMATWRRVSYHELVQATNQFHESNFLGAGAFGSVFKGTLSDGLDIAVKVFNQNMGEAFETFHNECEVMRNIRHMNLVKVITSCSSPDLKCLIMEYMPNGSLEKWLHSDHLSILQRLSIMIDVAKAVEYLHHGYSVPIIHCDLKPSNVILDGDMVAHVTDFGISKILTGGDSITQTLTLATIGYTAPEYGLEGIVSTQGDMYSYGIMLMETFTGKVPTDDMFAAGMSITQWVKKSLPQDIADVGLLNIEDQLFEKKRDCISEIMELAVGCCSDKREERPNITDIYTKLKKMQDRLLRDPRFIP